MSVWFDHSVNRWKIRIQRRGTKAREVLPAGTTRRQAEERHATLTRELYDVAVLGRRPRYSIADALDRYVTEEAPKLRRPDNVRSNIRALLPFIRGRDLSEIPDVGARVSEAAWSAATRNRRLALLRRVARLAARWGWLEAAPHVSLVPGEKARHEYLTRAEVELLGWLAEAWHPAAGELTIIAAYTGLRRGEILALTPADFDGESIHVRTSKNGRPRVVPVIERARGPLAAFLARPRRPGWRYLYRLWKNAAEAVRPGLRFHDLRHSTASMLVNAGVDLYVVGTILGHVDRRSTARYAHLSTESQRAALDRILGANPVRPDAPEVRKCA